jgi:hypothetical protein
MNPVLTNLSKVFLHISINKSMMDGGHGA